LVEGPLRRVVAGGAVGAAAIAERPREGRARDAGPDGNDQTRHRGTADRRRRQVIPTAEGNESRSTEDAEKLETAMKYMLSTYNREGCKTDDDRTECMIESLKVCDELKARGQFLDASPLQPVTTAMTVRVRDGETFITDGPFAETTVQLGGYF